MYNYYVMEIQTNADGTGGPLPYGFNDKGEAEDKFHALCISARQSQVMIDTVVFIDNKGNQVKPPACYVHPQEEVPQEAQGE